MTALEVIEAAFRLLNVLAVGQTLEAADSANGLEALNTMLHEWELNGVPVYHDDLAITDDIEMEASHLKAVKYNLALDLAPEYNDDISPILMNTALQSYAALERQYIDVDETELDKGVQKTSSWNILTD